MSMFAQQQQPSVTSLGMEEPCAPHIAAKISELLESKPDTIILRLNGGITIHNPGSIRLPELPRLTEYNGLKVYRVLLAATWGPERCSVQVEAERPESETSIHSDRRGFDLTVQSIMPKVFLDGRIANRPTTIGDDQLTFGFRLDDPEVILMEPMRKLYSLNV